jgi:hypothetical protein
MESEAEWCDVMSDSKAGSDPCQILRCIYDVSWRRHMGVTSCCTLCIISMEPGNHVLFVRGEGGKTHWLALRRRIYLCVCVQLAASKLSLGLDKGVWSFVPWVSNKCDRRRNFGNRWQSLAVMQRLRRAASGGRW